MSNCTNVGQSGNGISLADNPIPSGVICNLIGYGQSAGGQSAKVMDKNGTVVAQISCAGSAGGSIQPMLAPSGSNSFFTANNGPYTVTIANTGSQTSQVIKAYDAISAGTITYAGSWVFIAEDSPNGGDCDFNDCTVLLSWNLSAG
jgi:uncharacterized repeat protein (TIGR01451 family)